MPCPLGYLLLVYWITIQTANAVAYDHYLGPRQWTSRGVTIKSPQCTPEQIHTLSITIHDAVLLAEAGINAASSFETRPFSYFFKSDIRTANLVAGVLGRAHYSLGGKGPFVAITCDDIRHACDTPGGPTNAYALDYGGRPPMGPPIIVFCPHAFSSLKPNVAPCRGDSDTRTTGPYSSDTPSRRTLGYTMLYELMHIQSVAGPDLRIGDGQARFGSETQQGPGTEAMVVNRALRLSLSNTSEDAHAYGYLGGFAWFLGFGQPPAWNGSTCLEKWPALRVGL